MPDNSVILIGRITHLRDTLEFAAEFRINSGAVLCHLKAPLSFPVIERRGYPGHDVRVAGQLSTGKKKVLDVCSVELID